MTTTQDKPRIIALKLPQVKHSSVALKIGTTTFKCQPAVDGITLLEFAEIADMAGEDGEDISAADAMKGAAAMLDLLKTVLVDYDAFRAFFREQALDIEFLGEVASSLIEAYTDRPTQSPSES